jgi:oligopeptide transport system ATP-binding protein
VSATTAQREDPVDRGLLEIRDLSVDFHVTAGSFRPGGRVLRAVDGVNLTVQRGETLGLVGESGCGKTTLGRTILGLYRPAHGSVVFDGVDVGKLSGSELKAFRRRVQMIFQDPYASLNPRVKVSETIAEPLRAQGVGTPAERRARVAELLGLVGLPAASGSRYPHAFSGGQRQRIGIARALAIRPDLVIADEPVSALDVSIQAQIVNLLLDLREQLGLTLVFIAHDLAVVRQIATRIAVMYLGKIVEVGPTDQVFAAPRHPYTRALLAAVPLPDPDLERRRPHLILQGEVPSPLDPPSGCRFHTRCPIAMPVCASIEPALIGSGSSVVACHAVNPSDGPGWGPTWSGVAGSAIASITEREP